MFNDLRYALRQLLKNPGFTAVAVLTLALGIGANTAIFSTVNGVLLKPLPYSEAGQLVMVYEDESCDGRGLTAVAGGVFIDWKEQATCFDALSVISGTDMNLTGGEVPERLSGSQVSASFLNILRVKPIIGRSFSADEDQLGQDNKVVILSYELWQRRFGGDQSCVTAKRNGNPSGAWRKPLASDAAGFDRKRRPCGARRRTWRAYRLLRRGRAFKAA